MTNRKLFNRHCEDERSEDAAIQSTRLLRCARNDGKQIAFTLAEVLITLGVIGIVAAMTLPGLVANHREKQRVSQLKKVYSQLSQAYLMAVNEYGPVEHWDFATTDTGQVVDGQHVYDNSGTYKVTDIFKKYLKQSGKTEVEFRQYLSLDGRNYGSSGYSKLIDDGSIIFLPDGTIIMFGWVIQGCNNPKIGCGDIQVFLPEKVAQLGVSDFWFYWSPKGIIPYGLPSTTNSPFDSHCDKSNTTIASHLQGRGCTAWVLQNENMDYLHCDDLAWDGKHKCK